MSILEFIVFCFGFIVVMSIIFVFYKKQKGIKFKYNDLEVELASYKEENKHLQQELKNEQKKEKEVVIKNIPNYIEQSNDKYHKKNEEELTKQVQHYKKEYLNVNNKYMRSRVFIEFREISDRVCFEIYKELSRIIIHNGIEKLSELEFKEKIDNFINDYTSLFNESLQKSESKVLRTKKLQDCVGMAYFLYIYIITNIFNLIKIYTTDHYTYIENKEKEINEKLANYKFEENFKGTSIIRKIYVELKKEENERKIKLEEKRLNLLLYEYNRLSELFLGAFLERVKLANKG